MKQFSIIASFLLLLIAGCVPDAAIPPQSTPVNEQANIYPDYRDVTIPSNIAPLNIAVQSEGKAFVAGIEGGGRQILAAADEDGKLRFDSTEWRSLLHTNKGKDLTVTIYAQRDGGWVRFPSYALHVAAEPIDRYLSYRLIEPGYELYRQLGIYQRDLTTFDERVVYENNRQHDEQNNHCVNCHNFQNYSTQRMLFHVRAKHGGTVFIEGDKAKKMDMKNDSILSNCVYPTWHPTRNWVVFSTNKTGQAFHMTKGEKVEVVDYASDLVFYDADRGTLTNILKTKIDMETFPCWAPDGKKLYYCVAHPAAFEGRPDSTHIDVILTVHDKVYYNIMSMTFDERTRTFGTPQMEVDCAAMEKSATVPRISPDGRYLLFTLGSTGQFHIWHRDADQWVKDLQTGKIYPLTAANSPEVDSYHSWSSNGRWIVFSSRREDGNYTRPAIAYFDRNGQAHKAFILPQEDPTYHRVLLKSYNVPELTKDAVRISPEKIKAAVYSEPEKARYGR